MCLCKEKAFSARIVLTGLVFGGEYLLCVFFLILFPVFGHIFFSQASAKLNDLNRAENFFLQISRLSPFSWSHGNPNITCFMSNDSSQNMDVQNHPF